ncbi:MAG: zinc ABC transporter substrate-binding protein [Thalassobaculaceae bacterium]
MLVEGAASPHGYSLKPSQARLVRQAKVIFWVGPGLENFLVKPIDTLATDASAVSLLAAPGMELHQVRAGGAFGSGHHDHGEHGEKEDHHDDKHDDHAKKDDHHDLKHDDHAKKDDHHDLKHDDHAKKDDHHDLKHDDHAKKDDHHGDEQHHHEGGVDPHIWLDPANGKRMLTVIAKTLGQVDPANASAYAANAAAGIAELDQLTAEIDGLLAPVRGRAFIVFHDAYAYFEERFQVRTVGAIRLNPEVAPGLERVAAIRDKIKDLGAVCLFAEPQFQPKVLTVLTEGTQARTAVLDPLGGTHTAGPALYGALLRDLATSLRTCLGTAS